MTLCQVLTRYIDRRLHRSNTTARKRAVFNRADRPSALRLLTLGTISVIVCISAVSLMEWRFRPLITAAAEMAVQNQIKGRLEGILIDELSQVNINGDSLISIEKDGSGCISSLSSNVALLNRLRSRLLISVLTQMDSIETVEFEIPLKSLFHIGVFMHGLPSIPVSSVSVGSISAEYKSSFTGAGFNQTVYRVDLEVSAPVTLLLPGRKITVPVELSIPIAETVIVGQVPNTILRGTGL